MTRLSVAMILLDLVIWLNRQNNKLLKLAFRLAGVKQHAA